MLIAAALAVAITVNVSAEPGISPSLVARVLAETDAVWRSSGFTFEWQPGPREAGAAALQVVIGRGVRAVPNGGFALGWIRFADSEPQQEIYLSYTNAERLMFESPGVIGPLDRMPPFEKETMLARVMGRALAHEMGHYLLASKAHTVGGLMRAHVTASDFFGPDIRRFKLDDGQRSSITARLTMEAVVVSR